MNILLCNPNGSAFHYILYGIERAMRVCGHRVLRWDGKLETWDQFQPDLYVGCSGWRQDIPTKRGKTKVVIHANPHGTIRLAPVSGGPDINEPKNIIDWVRAQKPEAIFCYGYGRDLNKYWDKWYSEFGIPVIGMPTAGDHLSYYKVAPEKRFKCDLAYVGGYWQYKAVNIDKYLEPARKEFNTIIYGWGGWDRRSKGEISDEDVRKLFSSGRIGPCIHEPHTSVYGIDIPERVFKVPLCGLLAVCDPSPSLLQCFPHEIMPIAKTPKEYVDTIRHFLNNEEERRDMAEAQRLHILKNHTYLSRIKTLFGGIGFLDESLDVQKQIDLLTDSNSV